MAAAVILLLLLLAASVAAGNRCSDVSSWRFATMGESGPLVCAKLYGTPDCTDPFPLPFFVNSSVPDFSKVHTIAESWGTNATAVIRHGCFLRLWQYANYNGSQRSSAGNTYSVRIGSALSAKCDCATENRELLTCQPREEFVELKTCDNSGSESDAVCEYEWRQRPFHANVSNFTRLSDVIVSTVPDVEMDDMMNFFSKISKVPLVFRSKEFDERVVTVMSYEKLRVLQKMVICGQHAAPTSKINITRDVAPNTWLKDPTTNKLYYFSSDKVRREQADQRCREMNARLASTGPLTSYRFIANKIVHYDTNAIWWTAAEYRVDKEWTFSKGYFQIDAYAAVPNAPESRWANVGLYSSCVAINFAAPPYYFACHCYNLLKYICEKDELP